MTADNSEQWPTIAPKEITFDGDVYRLDRTLGKQKQVVIYRSLDSEIMFNLPGPPEKMIANSTKNYHNDVRQPFSDPENVINDLKEAALVFTVTNLVLFTITNIAVGMLTAYLLTSVHFTL
jgi:hypothetical protein